MLDPSLPSFLPHRLGHVDLATLILSGQDITRELVGSTFVSMLGCIDRSLQSLLAALAQPALKHMQVQKVYLGMLAPIEESPLFTQSTPAASLAGIRAILDAYNSEVQKMVLAFNRPLGKEFLGIVDFTSAFTAASATPPAPLSTKDKSCLVTAEMSALLARPTVTSLCTDASTYWFYDSIHPSSNTHKLVGGM